MPRIRPRSAIALLTSLLIAAAAIALAVQEWGPHGWGPLPSRPVSPSPHGRPLIGVNYTHTSFAGCSPNGTGIIADGQRAGIGPTAVRQLTQMRREGVDALRLIVWHMSDPTRQDWGVIPSASGRIDEPYRTNLINYLRTARRLGYRRLTVSFAPQWTNNPKAVNYDPAKLDENWRFLVDVRSLVKRFGPPSRIDLLNEGAPSSFADPQITDQLDTYVTTMYSRYARAFGTADVLVSAAGPNSSPTGNDRLANLVRLLRSTGYPLPRMFEIHLNQPSSQVLTGLLGASRQLAALHLDQPLIIGETSYDDPRVAQAIATFLQRSSRPILEVIEWYKRPGSDCSVSPPYSIASYLHRL